MTATLEETQDELFMDNPGLFVEDPAGVEPELVEAPVEPTVAEPETASIVVPKALVQVIQLAPSGKEILSTCIDLAVFLAQKNISYGDSFTKPIGIFSKAEPLEQIKVRIDDKLNRISHGQHFGSEDDIKDLLGYLILYFVAKENNG